MSGNSMPISTTEARLALRQFFAARARMGTTFGAAWVQARLGMVAGHSYDPTNRQAAAALWGFALRDVAKAKPSGGKRKSAKKAKLDDHLLHVYQNGDGVAMASPSGLTKVDPKHILKALQKHKTIEMVRFVGRGLQRKASSVTRLGYAITLSDQEEKNDDLTRTRF